MVLSAFVCACHKEEFDSENATFLKSIETEGPYLSRNVIALEDGSVILSCVGFENRNNTDEYGLLPSFIVKLNAEGEEIWRTELPEIVHQLWTCRLLSNGNVLILGFNSDPLSDQVGVVIISNDGEQLYSTSFLNQVASISLIFNWNSVDGKELQNGTIGVVMPSINSANGQAKVRLLIMSQSLAVLDDVIYEPGDVVVNTRIYQPSIDQTSDGKILIQGRTLPYIDEAFPHFAFVMEIDESTLEPIYYQVFTSEFARIPSRMCASDANDAVWFSTGPFLDQSLAGSSLVNFRNQEQFYCGTEIECWKTNNFSQPSYHSKFGGFPKNAIVQNVEPCSDGGYILIGTCNINSNQSIPSSYRILLAKLSPSLQLEWLRVPDTNSSALGADVVEIPGGFLVSATHYTPEGIEKPLVFKTDTQGIIQ